MRKFWQQFCRDRRGNYALMTAIAMVPLMGALAMAVDFSELNRQKQMVLNALDAANFAAARRLAEGATDDQIRAYAVDFFNANLNNIDPANVALMVSRPPPAWLVGSVMLSEMLAGSMLLRLALKKSTA